MNRLKEDSGVYTVVILKNQMYAILPPSLLYPSDNLVTLEQLQFDPTIQNWVPVIESALNIRESGIEELTETRELESIAVSNISMQEFDNKSSRKYQCHVDSFARAFSGGKQKSKEGQAKNDNWTTEMDEPKTDFLYNKLKKEKKNRKKWWFIFTIIL